MSSVGGPGAGDGRDAGDRRSVGDGRSVGDRRKAAAEPEVGVASTFEQLMAELEDITAKLAAGDLGIEAAADLYERAERLHALARERLQQVRTRVEGLTRPGSSGEATGGP